MIELLSVGEVLWDLFPDGKRLGGAPFNVAFHAQQLGVEAGSVSRVGSDALGEEILEEARKLGLPVELVQVDATLPTGTVTVKLDEAGQPSYTITENVAWDAVELTDDIDAILDGVRALAFGTLAQRAAKSRATIREVLRRSGARYKLYDINLRPPFYTADVIRASLEAATVLKLNDDELVTVRGMFELPDSETDACRALCREFDLELICVTKGDRGCTVHGAAGASDIPGKRVTVADTVGSGDAFSAGLLVRLLNGDAPEEAARYANAVGAVVASKAGGTPPVSPDEITI